MPSLLDTIIADNVRLRNEAAARVSQAALSKSIDVDRPAYRPTKVGQSLKTPLYERDFELEPSFPDCLNVETGIKRVWASMFGLTGAGLKAFRASSKGLMISTDVDLESARIVLSSQSNVAQAGSTDVALGGYADYITGIVTGGVLSLSSLDSLSAIERTVYCDPGAWQTSDNLFYGRFAFWLRANSIRFGELANITTTVYYTAYAFD